MKLLTKELHGILLIGRAGLPPELQRLAQP